MMAAVIAARNGNGVTLIEKNEKLGKKLYVTGKGRCNVTNACDTEHLFQNIVSNAKFLYSSFTSFTNHDVIHFFEELHCPLKTERGERVFPVSDKSSDIIKALSLECSRLNVTVLLSTEVEQLIIKNHSCLGVVVQQKKGVFPLKELFADAVILSTGGLSYPSTGSTGDGYRFAGEAGLAVTEPFPALVPLETEEDDPVKMQGLTLKNIEVSFWSETDGKKHSFYRGFGEMIFTHFGVSGPVIMSGSSYCSGYLRKGKVRLTIDLKPALTEEELERRIIKDFEEMKNALFKNALFKLLPKVMVPVMVERSRIDPDKKVNMVTKEERRYLLRCIKAFSLNIKNTRGFSEAVITKGGVKVNEINPSTMESKKIKNLYFAGEVLDLDALTGGYNLQIAWSTGYLAGSSV